MRASQRCAVSLLAAACAGALVFVSGCWGLAPDSALGFLDASDTGTTLAEGGGGGDDATVTGDTGVDGSTPPGDAAPPDGADADVVEAATTPPYALGTIAAGEGFACHVDATGAVWCWGDDSFGQTGSTPTATPVAHPAQVAGVTGAVAVAAGDHHACAVTTGGAVYCWGLNAEYQLGHAAATSGDLICPGASPGQTVPCSPVPTAVAGVTAVSIQAAGASTCAVAAGGTVQCWGAVQAVPVPDGGVPCGNGAQAQGGSCYPSPYAIGGVSGATSLALGYDHACAVVPAMPGGGGGSDSDDAGDGGDAGDATAAATQALCWGNDNEGQVSPSACPGSDCTIPIIRSDLAGPVGLAAGDGFTCALGADGVVRCFGDNSSGELGHAPGTSGDLGAGGDAATGIFNATASAVGGVGSAISLVGGGHQTSCAITSGGAVSCWGGLDGSAGAPVTIAGLPPMLGLGTFDATWVCGQALDGGIWCFSLVGSPAPAQVQ